MIFLKQIKVNRWLSITLMVVCVQSIIAKLGIRETKVEPFSLLLDNQRQIIEKVNFIITNIKNVESLENKISSLAYEVTSANVWAEDTYHNMNALKDEVKNMSQDFWNTRVTHSFEPDKNAWQHPCEALKHLFKNNVQDLEECRTIIMTTNFQNNDTIIVKEKQREVMDDTNKEQNIKLEADDVEIIKNTQHESIQLRGGEKAAETNAMAYLKQAFSSATNQTNQKLKHLLSLLQNIEYRQHVSAITQDTRLNTLLHKMAVHQTILEGRLTNSLKSELFNAHLNFENTFEIFEDHLIREKQIFNGLVSVAANLSMALGELNLLRINGSCWVSNNCSQIENVDFNNNITSVNASSLPSKFDVKTFNVTPLNPWKEEIVPDDFHGDQVPLNESVKNATNYLLNNAFSLDQFDFSKNDVTHEIDSLTKANLNEEKYKLLNNLVENATNVQDVKKSSMDEIITRISDFISKQIKSIENSINKQILKTEDTLTGLRIHQSSEFYSHSKEVRRDLDKLERSLSKAIDSSGNKIAKKLEGVRKALFTFIDAAVTSVTSAAVTSSQSMGLLMAKELRASLKEIGKKMAEMGADRTKHQECPAFYEKIGGKCLLLLPWVGTSWRDGCRLCKALGGDLSHFVDNTTLPGVGEAWQRRGNKDLWVRTPGYPTEAVDCEFESEREEFEELTNSLDEADSPPDGASSTRNETELFCSFLSFHENGIKTRSCAHNLGVICQSQISS